tara:strand:- start:484 stop:1011 length:528 start_codon:yes stop_codon:yes gene_type:complete
MSNINDLLKNNHIKSLSNLEKGVCMSNQETSIEALSSIEHQITNITDRVYQLISSTGNRGITDDEGYRTLKMNPNTYRPSRVSLMEKGLVVNTNKKGITQSGRKAWLWKAIPKEIAVPPSNLNKRKRKTAPKIDPQPVPEEIKDITLIEARDAMLAKLTSKGECRCPCCGINVSN